MLICHGAYSNSVAIFGTSIFGMTYPQDLTMGRVDTTNRCRSSKVDLWWLIHGGLAHTNVIDWLLSECWYKFLVWYGDAFHSKVSMGRPGYTSLYLTFITFYALNLCYAYMCVCGVILLCVCVCDYGLLLFCVLVHIVILIARASAPKAICVVCWRI